MLDRLHDVKYVVIGGIAAILHGAPRATFDPAILIGATPASARRLLDALRDAGPGTAALTSPEDVLTDENNHLSRSSARGCPDFRPRGRLLGCMEGSRDDDLSEQELHVLSRTHLIASKRAFGRDVDLEDARLLGLHDEPEARSDWSGMASIVVGRGRRRAGNHSVVTAACASSRVMRPS
jgi:hypothetical protein